MATVPNRDTATNTTFGVPEANQPFFVQTDPAEPGGIGAVYDSGDDEIDVTVGPGRANFGNGLVVEQTADTLHTGVVVAPALSTTYYVFLLPDGTAVGRTSPTGPGYHICDIATDGVSVANLTVTDRRGFAAIVADPLTAAAALGGM